MPRSQSVPSRSRMFLATGIATALAATVLVSDVRSASAEEERATPVVGSFAVGGSPTAGVDERTGMFSTQVPVSGLPSLGGLGAVSLTVSYSQDAAAAGSDPDGLGAGWGWNVSHVLTEGGVQVVTPSGVTYHASAKEGSSDSAEMASGLSGYVQGDLVFSQTGGTLDSRDGETGHVAYAYSLEYVGGVTDYFDAAGHIVARTGSFGGYDRVDWLWDDNHLVGVIDGAGSRLTMNWSDMGVEVVSPPRSDGVIAKTTVEITGHRLVSVTDAIDQKATFAYDSSGLMTAVTTDTGTTTEVTYQPLPNNHVENNARVVKEVRVLDLNTGALLSTRKWGIEGDHNPQGSPSYNSAGQMWAAGDGEYRYRTVLTDGATKVVSEYNSMGLMLTRHVVVSTGDGEVLVQEQGFTYQGTETGGVPQKQQVPEQYAKPLTTQVTYHENAGKSRQVTEKSVYDKAGRVTEHSATDGSVTTTEYDPTIPEGKKLPIGLVTKQTTTGVDGTVSETRSTSTPDSRALTSTETWIASVGGELERTSRTEFVIDADGLVVEQKIVAVGNVADGPEEVATRFDRIVDTSTKTVTLSRTHAFGTTAQSTTSTVTDLVTGLELSVTDPAGRVARSIYDRAGRVLIQTQPGNLRTVTEYGEKVTRVTDPVGVTRSTYVDALGQVIRTTDNITDTGGGTFGPGGVERTVEQRRYEQNGAKTTVTDARGLESVTITDVFGRPVSVTGPSGVEVRKKYDDVANTVTSGIIPPSGSGFDDALTVTTTQLDDGGRQTGTASNRQDGVSVPRHTTTYDGLGRTIAQTGGDVSTNVVLNPDGTPKTTTMVPAEPRVFPGEIVTADREHDMLGTSTRKTLSRADGDVRDGVTRVLDATGNTVSETNQAGHTTRYMYTVDGLLSRADNEATGVITRNTYDPVTRTVTLTETVAADGIIAPIQFVYDPVTTKLVEACDPTNCDGTRMSHTYDVFGNITQTRYPDGKTIRHTFDEFGRQKTSIDIDGNVTVFEYDHIGLLVQVMQSNPEGVVLGRVQYTYDVFGRMTKLTRDNNVTTDYTFTSANEILTETTKRDGTVIHDAAYEYDTHGNLTLRVDTRPKERDTSILATETTVYAYNAYNQLISSSVHTGVITGVEAPEPISQTRYEIGVAGEVNKETTTTNGTASVREFEYDALGQTTAIITDGERIAQKYDIAGNLTDAADGTTYVYNVHNQAIKETTPNDLTTEHTYWINGQRNTTTTDASGNPTTNTTQIHWDGMTLSNETHTASDTNTSVTASYLIGASRHARTLTNRAHGAELKPTTDYYVADRHGNTTATTASTGEVTATYTYTDYGIPTEYTAPEQTHTPAGRNPFQYAAEYTAENGKQHLNKRIYDPTTHAFTTKDTADQFNLYAYANSNPITLVDPTGQTAVEDIINGVFIGVTVISAAISAAVMAIPTGGASLVALGVAAVAILADLSAATLAAVQLADHHSGQDLISNETSEIFTWVGVGLGFGTALALTGATASILRAAQRWEDSVLLMDLAGNAVARELTHLNGRQIRTAINEMMGRTGEAAGKNNEMLDFLSGIEFLFVHQGGAPQRVAIGKLTAQETQQGLYRFNGKFGPFTNDSFISPFSLQQRSSHEALGKMMRLDLPDISTSTYEDMLQYQYMISGGRLTWAYPQKSGAGFRFRSYMSSGHFASRNPDVFWSPTVRADYTQFFKNRGIRTKIYDHDAVPQNQIDASGAKTTRW